MSERTDPTPKTPSGDADIPPTPRADDAGAGAAAAADHAADAAEPRVAEPGDPVDPLDPLDPPQRPRRFWLLAIIALMVYVLDQLTKIIAVANLNPDADSPRILGGLIYFSLIRNPGAAFSMATGMTWVLAVVAVIVVVVIIRIAARLRSVWWAVSLGLILGGALGNLTDRIFRSPGFFRGHVVDFVSVFGPNGEYFPIFNVADSAITVGGVLLVVTALQGIEFDGSRATRKAKVGRSATDGNRTDG